MKTSKKILSVLLAFILAVSCFGMLTASAAKSNPDASSVTIYVTPPSVGSYPSSSGIGKSSNLITLQGYTWGERAPGESSYHVMQGSFKEGYRYRIYIDYASPDASLDSTVIYVNGNYPTGRSDDNYVYGTLYYDFGTLSSGSSGSGSSGSGSSGSGGSSSDDDSGFSFLGLLMLPLEIILFPFFFILTVFGII